MFSVPFELILTFVLVLVRVLFFFALMPIFGDRYTPVRVRLLLACAVAFVFTPLLSPDATALPTTVPQFAAVMLPEAALGAAFGLVGRILFGAIQFAGQVMGEQIGFGLGSKIDPTQTTQIPVVAQMLFLASLLVFFLTNAHHFFFGALARSFELAPPGFLSLPGDLAAFFVERTSAMFVTAVQLSLPIVAASFIVEVALGMIAKGVPQLNVFIESFPIRIMVGLFLISVISAFLVEIIVGLFGDLHEHLLNLLQLFAV